jgi:hypothetical protein
LLEGKRVKGERLLFSDYIFVKMGKFVWVLFSFVLLATDCVFANFVEVPSEQGKIQIYQLCYSSNLEELLRDFTIGVRFAACNARLVKTNN